MMVVEANDAVHSIYRAGTQTPDGGEAEAGRFLGRCHTKI